MKRFVHACAPPHGKQSVLCMMPLAYILVKENKADTTMLLSKHHFPKSRNSMYVPTYLCLYVQPKEKSPCSLQGSPTKAHRLVCHGAPSQSLAEEVSPLPPHALLVQSGEELVQPRQAPCRLGGAVTARHLCIYIHEIYHDIYKMRRKDKLLSKTLQPKKCISVT